MSTYTLQDIPEFTAEMQEELTKLTKSLNEKIEGQVGSRKRLALVYLKGANMFKDFATDDLKDEEADAEFERQALRQYVEGYLKYSA